MPLQKISIGRYITVFLGIFITLLITYSPAVLGYYAHLDDYSYFWGLERKDFSDIQLYHLKKYSDLSDCGRFLGIFVFFVLDSIVQSVRDLNIVRFFNIFNFSLGGLVCFYWMDKYLSNTLMALFFSVLIFTLPPSEAIVSYSIGFFVASALFPASCAAVLASRATLVKSFWKLMINPYAIGAVTLLLYSLMTYQTAAMFYWVFVALYILSARFEKIKEFYTPIGNLFCIGLSAMVIYGIIVKLLQGIYISKAYYIYNPTYITTDYFRKLKWFLQAPLTDSLNLWNIFPTKMFAISVSIFIVVTYLFFLYRSVKNYYLGHENIEVIKKKITGLFLFLILIFLSFLPNLLAIYDFPWYRSCLALTTMILIILLWAVHQWVSLLVPSQQRLVMTIILSLSCIWGTVQAYHNVLYYRVIPSSLEFEYIKTTLQEHDLTKFQTIRFICPQRPLIAPSIRYDEFGVLTTYYPSSHPYVIKCILTELGLHPRFIYSRKFLKYSYHGGFYYIHITSNQANEPEPLRMGKTLLIDMTKLYKND